MNNFSNIQVSLQELEYFNQLSKEDQINYIYDLYDYASGLLYDEDDVDDNEIILPDIATNDPNAHKVEIMIDDANILFESNHLKSLKIVKSKFIENGYIISRSKALEKQFKDSKVTRYLRVYDIIGKISAISIN